jgi:UDP-glucuronate 4-epimerase
MGKTLLVTGAAGFIGSHVVARHVARGDRVVGLDNLNAYYAPERKRANLAELVAGPGGERFTFVEGDVRDRAELARLFAAHAFDAVVHLAAMAGVRASIDDPELYFSVNLDGTLALLDAARRRETRPQFVLASTSSVYGNSSRPPFVETEPCDRPLAPYPASKRAAEMLGFTYHHLYGQAFTALRFFTVYGPRGRPDMLAYKVLDSICFGREVPLYRGGQMHRDWTFVDDIAAGIEAAVDTPLGYAVLNLGRGDPVLVADFIVAIEALVGKKARFVDRPMQDADVAYTHADVGQARKLLGYQPKVSVREGVDRLWAWYRSAVLGATR